MSSCSEISRQAGEPLIGTAPPRRVWMLLECSPPWEFNITDSKHFPSLRGEFQLDKTRASLLGVHHLSEESNGKRRFIVYRLEEQNYSRHEFLLPDDPETVEAALIAAQNGRVDQIPGARQENSDRRDLVICVHGTHDACCGRYGAELLRQLEDRLSGAPDAPRLIASSHLGGHRFAPTLLDFPEGRMWGRLTAEKAVALIRRDRPILEVADCYRGWSRLAPAEQMAEKVLFDRYGWSWTESKTWFHLLESTEEETEIRIDFQNPANVEPERAVISLHRAPRKDFEIPMSCGDEEKKPVKRYDVSLL